MELQGEKNKAFGKLIEALKTHALEYAVEGDVVMDGYACLAQKGFVTLWPASDLEMQLYPEEDNVYVLDKENLPLECKELYTLEYAPRIQCDKKVPCVSIANIPLFCNAIILSSIRDKMQDRLDMSIHNLRLSERTRNALLSANIQTIRDLLAKPIDPRSMEDLRQAMMNTSCEAMKESEQPLQRIYISQSNLSSRTNNTLKRTDIHHTDELIKIPLDQIANERSIGTKTLEESRQFILDFPKENGQSDITTQRYLLSKEQMDELATHSIEELQLSVRSYNALRRNEYTQLNQIIVLSREEIKQIKGLGRFSVDEIISQMELWLLDNHIQPIEENVEEDERTPLFKQIAKAIEPLAHVSWKEITQWLTVDGILLSDSLEDGICMVLSLEKIKPRLVNFWLGIAPDGMLTPQELGSILQKLQLSFDPLIVTQVFLKTGIIVQIENMYFLKRSFFLETIPALRNQSDRGSKMLLMRMEGKRLQEIGDAFGLTRERVRKIILRASAQLPMFADDYFAKPYMYFHLPIDVFCRLFPESSPQGARLLQTRYQTGEKQLTVEEAKNYDGPWKQRIMAFVQDEDKRLCHENVTRNSVIYNILQSNGSSLSVNDLLDHYRKYINQNNLPEKLLKLNERTLANHLRHAQGIVFNRDNMLRLCDVDPGLIWDAIDFNLYRNTIISAELIFRDYIDLMQELDIRDSYELFCIIKNSLSMWKGSFEIKCRRIPVIVMGNASDEEQALSLLREISPIDSINYYVAYEERFGIWRTTAAANPMIGQALLPYYANGIYDIGTPLVAQEDAKAFANALASKDLWFAGELEELFEKTCIHTPKDALNRAALYQFGYLLYSGYAISSAYGSALGYLEQEIFSKDVIHLGDIDHRLRRTSMFKTVLEREKTDLQFFECADKELVSIRKIEEDFHLDAEKIRLLQTSMASQYQHAYFNAWSLMDEIKNFPLIQKFIGHEWLLTSIMYQQEGIYMKRVAGSVILSTDSNSLSIHQICQWLVKHHGKLTLQEMTNLFNKTFACKLTSKNLAEKLQETGTWDEIICEPADQYKTLVDFSQWDFSDLL